MPKQLFLTILVLAVLTSPPLAAQSDPSPGGAPTGALVQEPSFLASVADDTLMALVDYRSAEAIRADLDNALGQQAIAEQNLVRAQLLLAQAEARIKLKGAEISSLKMQEDLAKNEHDEILKKEIEARKRRADSQKQMLEKRRDLRRREIGVMEARRDFFKTGAKVCEREFDLAAKRGQRGGIATQPVSGAVRDELARIGQQVGQAEKKVLEGQLEMAAKWKQVADREAELAKARLSLFESQMKIDSER